MNLFPAQAFDIDSIMKIERQAFIPQIQEKKSTFEKRIMAFPNGFLILSDASEAVVKANGSALTCGYFSSEIWDSMPSASDSDELFARKFSLGHDIKATHNENGAYLYVSSFALLRDYQGKGLGKKFFESSLGALCGSFPKIKKIVLLVNSEWQSAIKIYKSLGFSEIRILKDFFPTFAKTGFFSFFEKKIFADGIVMTCDAEKFKKTEFENSENVWAGVKI